MAARTAIYIALTILFAAVTVERLGHNLRAQSSSDTGAEGPVRPQIEPDERDKGPRRTPATPAPLTAAPQTSASGVTPPADGAAPTTAAPARPPAAPVEQSSPRQTTPADTASTAGTAPAAAMPVTPPPAAAPAAIPPTDKPAIENPPVPPIKTEPADKKQTRFAARDLFGASKLPSIGQAAAIGYYPKGCLSGGVKLPVDGSNWQVMRLSRNRNWGHPDLIQFVETFAGRAAKATGWKGILVGDLAQPRGGPTPFGHRSHQTGLDVDIWFMPMPDRRLTRVEREEISASNLVASDWKRLDPKTWTPQHVDFIRTAAIMPNVERVLVNAAIKKELCRVAGKSADWLKKVRPWYGHHDHIHVRLKCPADSPGCQGQPSIPDGEGCGKELDSWFSDKVLKPVTKFKPVKPLTLAELPAACKTVLSAPAR